MYTPIKRQRIVTAVLNTKEQINGPPLEVGVGGRQGRQGTGPLQLREESLVQLRGRSRGCKGMQSPLRKADASPHQKTRASPPHPKVDIPQ